MTVLPLVRHEETIGCLALGSAHFKHVNDRFGHQCGAATHLPPDRNPPAEAIGRKRLAWVDQAWHQVRHSVRYRVVLPG